MWWVLPHPYVSVWVGEFTPLLNQASCNYALWEEAGDSSNTLVWHSYSRARLRVLAADFSLTLLRLLQVYGKRISNFSTPSLSPSPSFLLFSSPFPIQAHNILKFIFNFHIDYMGERVADWYWSLIGIDQVEKGEMVGETNVSVFIPVSEEACRNKALLLAVPSLCACVHWQVLQASENGMEEPLPEPLWAPGFTHPCGCCSLVRTQPASSPSFSSWVQLSIPAQLTHDPSSHLNIMHFIFENALIDSIIT